MYLVGNGLAKDLRLYIKENKMNKKLMDLFISEYKFYALRFNLSFKSCESIEIFLKKYLPQQYFLRYAEKEFTNLQPI